MSDEPSELPTRTGSFRAVVRVGTTVTEYSRSGSGKPVVVLGLTEALRRCPRSVLQEALSSRFKVILPESSPTPGEFVGWLRAFLDGLGLGRVSLVADDSLGVAAIGFTLIESDRVDHLVLISGCGPDSVALGAALADVSQQSACPLLMVSLDQPSENITGQVVEFLSGQPPQRP